MGYPHIRGTVVAAEWQPSFIHLWPGIGCPDFLRPFEDTPPPSAIVTLEYPYAHSGVAVGFFCALCATPLPRPTTRFRDLQPTKFQNTEEPYMGFNYAAEKKKFETLWARLRREYRAAGMSDAAIQKMHDFDWEVFKQERIYRLHTQDLGIGIFDEPSAEQEDKSALMKKFLESVSRWDDYTTASRYGWIEGIGDQRLVRVLKRLSISEKELLTKYCIEEKTQQEIAAEMGLSQRAVGKQLQQLKNFFRKF